MDSNNALATLRRLLEAYYETLYAWRTSSSEDAESAYYTAHRVAYRHAKAYAASLIKEGMSLSQAQVAIDRLDTQAKARQRYRDKY